MKFSYMIMAIAAIGVILGFYMKFNEKNQVANAYIKYKTNFLIVVGMVIIIIQGLGLAIPAMSQVFDMVMAVFLIFAIIIDTMAKRKMRR